MGLLDDAIRDHLELKRRRGADPSEVEREQHEALDPPAGTSSAVAESHDGLEADSSGAPPGEMKAEPAMTAAGAAEAGESSTEVQETAELDMQAVLEDEPERDHPASAHGAAEEYSGDVLKETPNFLRETPEQDRLWFEQRPPRDFDFEG